MRYRAKCILATLAVVMLAVGRVDAQPDPNLKPTFGAVALKAGFTPDPLTKDLVAGGPIKTNLGGVNAYVAKAPDFGLQYTKGTYPLTFSVQSTADTTLLINLPDGSWIADDDGGVGLNPLIRIPNPQSGRYDIYVGTYGKDTVPATLIITELSPPKVDPVIPKGSQPDCYIVSAGVDNYRNATKLNGCLNDARNTVTAFRAQTGNLFRKVEAQTLLDGTATRAGIMQLFQSFSQKGAAGDYMVLFLSGHGGRTNNNTIWYFMPVDFHPNNFATTTLTDKQLLDAADVVVKQKKNVVIIVDACFCGQMRITAQPYLNRYQNTQQGGLVLMFSSNATQTSSALGQFSAFAKAFADAMTPSGDLNRDGKVTLGEIQSYSQKRTDQLLAQSRINNPQQTIVAWSPSISRETPFAATSKLAKDPVTTTLPTGNATRYVGSETLAGYGKLSFSLYPGGRTVMVDAMNTAEGTWQQNGNQYTFTFFTGSVIYQGTLNGATLSGSASSPGARTEERKTWNWTVQLQK